MKLVLKSHDNDNKQKPKITFHVLDKGLVHMKDTVLNHNFT